MRVLALVVLAVCIVQLLCRIEPLPQDEADAL